MCGGCVKHPPGTFGDVSVNWEVKGSNSDITPVNGYTNFTAGQTEGFIQLIVTDHEVSETLLTPKIFFAIPGPFLLISSCVGPIGVGGVLCHSSKCHWRWKSL